MKTIVEINGINYSSTGNIALNIAKELRNEGFKVYTACKKSRVGVRFQYEDQIFIGTRLDRVISERIANLTGYKGCYNIINTYLFLKKLDEIKPDLIHMHLLHDTFINLRMLFDYIKKKDIPVVWTFHDCWAFTGQCSYFDAVKCDKWKTGCHDCPQTKIYPKTYFADNTRKMWDLKKKWFNGVRNMTIVTPSAWLKDLVGESFLKEYPIQVIYNGINLDIFKPVSSDFRERYDLKDKKIVLGVAYNWDERKGLDVFIELAKRLPDDYRIIMVGTNDEVDKILPGQIISIHKTYNQEELVEIYSQADVFINPTRQDNFPTVNIEALACGAPVIAFRTGGCPEIIDESCGSIVEKEDVDALEKEIIRICEKKPFNRDDLVKKASEYSMGSKFKEYAELIKDKLNDQR